MLFLDNLRGCLQSRLQVAAVQYTRVMNANPYPTALTDAEWALSKDVIPPPKPGGRHRALDMRAVVKPEFEDDRYTILEVSIGKKSE